MVILKRAWRRGYRSNSPFSFSKFLADENISCTLIDPSHYCSRTVFEDATHKLVKHFFLDDGFRSNIMMQCYVRGMPHRKNCGSSLDSKFPFVYNDSEYIIGIHNRTSNMGGRKIILVYR